MRTSTQKANNAALAFVFWPTPHKPNKNKKYGPTYGA